MSWLPSSINYQVNLRSLAAREPRNAFEAIDELLHLEQQEAPLRYVASHLKKLKQLGITVIHLMPPFPIGLEARKGIGSPYAVQDYLSIEPEYGTLNDLKDLIKKAHTLGFKIILGMVPNHTSRDNVWTQSNPEYYVQGEDGKPAYDLDWSDTAKLDYTNKGLRKAMHEVYAYWLDLLDGDGIDGFRIDMAHFINDPSFWDESLPKLKAAHPKRELLFMAECYGIGNNLELFQRGMNAAYDDDLYKVCEIFYGKDTKGNTILRDTPNEEDLKRFPQDWEAFKQGGIKAAAERVIQTYNEQLPNMPHPCYLMRYTDNHDEGRGLYRFGPGAVRAFNTLIFSLPSTIPFLLTGQEFGALNRPSIHERGGICDKGYHFFDGQNWSKREGFELEGNLFDRGREQRGHWFSFFQTLIQRRETIPALRSGKLTLIDAQENATGSQKTVIALALHDKKQRDLVVINLGPEPRQIGNQTLLRGHFLAGRYTKHNELPPFSTVILEQ